MAIAKKPLNRRPAVTAPTDERAAEAFIAQAGSPAEAPDTRRIPVTMRFDPAMLKRTDAAAKRLGISRSAYVHIALSRALAQEP